MCIYHYNGCKYQMAGFIVESFRHTPKPLYLCIAFILGHIRHFYLLAFARI